MSYKTILAYLPSPDHVTRLKPMIETVARGEDAHVVGFHAMPAIRMYSGAEVPIPAEIYERQREVFREQADKTEAAFTAAFKSSGLNTDWKCKDSFEPDVGYALVEVACTADLVVMEQDEPDPLDFGWDLGSTVVLDSGRPVLLKPQAVDVSGAPKSVVIAWNGSREAARAAFDALPFLTRADSVKILSVNPPDSQRQGRFAPGEDLAVALARHGIEARVHVAEGRSASAELVKQVSSLGADLLVMGCYGHSRLREAVIGGATRQVLSAMKVPVLMSH